MIHGVDVASFQGQPGSWRTEAGDITWAGVKICELDVSGSRYVDPDAAADWAWLRERGLGRIAYAYAHPATLPSATVALLAAELHALGLEDGDAVALDLEVTDDLSPAEVSAYGRATMAALKATFEREPLLYTFLAFADDGNCAGLGSYPLWIADPSRPAGQPRVPPPWKTWAVHQHNWTPIDADVARWPTLDAMRAAIGKPSPAKPRLAPEDTMLLTRGAGAVTPVAIPQPCTRLRLYCAGTADLEWQLVGEPAHDLKLTGAESQVITLPAGKHAVKVTRKDAGDADVCAVAEA